MTNEEIAQIAALIAGALQRQQTNQDNTRLDRIERTLDKLAATAERHNDEIQALIALTSENSEAIRQTWEAIRNLERNWQAYLTTIHPKQ